MDQAKAKVVKELERQRLRLDGDISELERRVREVSNWRTYFAKAPWIFLAFAFSGTFILSKLVRRE